MAHQDADNSTAILKPRRNYLLKDLMASSTAVFGLVVILLVIFMAVFAPIITDKDPKTTNLRARLTAPIPFADSIRNFLWEQMP